VQEVVFNQVKGARVGIGQFARETECFLEKALRFSSPERAMPISVGDEFAVGIFP
jgi:hypothetical protein